nr:SAM-dependent methyltransferase [Lacticaseibacillus absianus]
MAAACPTPLVTQQLNAMTTWRQAVAHGQLPVQPLIRLGLPAEERLSTDPVVEQALHRFDQLARNFRQYIAYHYGMWAFVSQTLAETWQATYGPQRYLEVAAGNGYLSAGLQAAGSEVITTDPLSWVGTNATGRAPLVPVQRAGATAALWRYGHAVDAVVMAWSPDQEWNDAAFLHTLRAAFPQLQLFVIGERHGATNSRLFWQQARFVPDRRLLTLNRAFPQFDAINDRIYRMR